MNKIKFSMTDKQKYAIKTLSNMLLDKERDDLRQVRKDKRDEIGDTSIDPEDIDFLLRDYKNAEQHHLATIGRIKDLRKEALGESE